MYIYYIITLVHVQPQAWDSNHSSDVSCTHQCPLHVTVLVSIASIARGKLMTVEDQYCEKVKAWRIAEN